MPDRALVEAVALELEPVEVEIDEQVALEEPRRLVRQPPSAEVGMDREAAEVRDPASAVRQGELHHPRLRPALGLRHLDDEEAELARFGGGGADLLEDGVRVTRPG